MTVHLIKLAAGIINLSGIAERLAERTIDDAKIGPMVPVFTRNTPKKSEELLQGGSLYWVAKGRVIARSPFKDVRPQTDDAGRAYCELCIAPELVQVQPVPKRAFQGWRYLSVSDAPADIVINDSLDGDIPQDMLVELQELGLL